MKRTLKRLLCVFLVTLMCVTMLPMHAFAWSYMSHTNSANILRMEMLSHESPKNIVDIFTLKNDEKDQKFSYSIPSEFYNAIKNYPEAFRAGALGPDFYPDMLIGQMYIHPYDAEAQIGSGDWLSLLIDSVNRLPQYSEGRLEALAFTLGYMLHYCGDMFGHDFVNTFTGGTFPSFMDVNILDSTDPELNNILSHMSTESLMDDLVNYVFWGDEGQLAIDAPTRFITDSMVLDGNVSSGVADIYYGFEPKDVEGEDEEVADMLAGVPIYLDMLVSFRAKVMNVADKFRDNTELITMGISSYADQWALDIDRAIYGLADTFDMIAHRLVTGEKNPAIKEETLHDWVLEGYPLKEILKDRLDLDKIDSDNSSVSVILEELSLWLETYGWKALGIPDVFVDGLPEWMDYITLVFTWPMDVVMAAVKTALSYIFAEIIVAAVGSEVNLLIGQFEAFKARLEDPEVQLDHRDNPYKPSENNYAELKEYLKRYYNEQKLLIGQTTASLLQDADGTHVLDQLVDSDFEAFYNTMTMFKLILMGPVNFGYFFKSQTGIEQTEYTTNTAELEATVLRLDVKTIDQQWSGTDDNVYAYVFKVDENGTFVEHVATKLLDNSLNNDLECGDTNTFYIDLPKPMKLDEIEIVLDQKGTATTDGGWACENITVTPMHAGVALCYPIGVGGNLYMDEGKTWNLGFQNALNFHCIGGEMHSQMPVTHVEVRIQTGNGDYSSGTDQDVKIEAWDSTGYSVRVDLDKYLYDDFEDGDDDKYIVPLGEYDQKAQRNTYPTLGDMTLVLRHYSDYDWYIKNITVTPYCGTLKLTEPMDFGTFEFKEETDKLTLSPSTRINNGTASFITHGPLVLTYETSLDCGLLDDMRSLDAGMQWYGECLPVFWDTVEGINLFYKLFKGFSPEIELSLDEDIIGATDPLGMHFTFTGKWNGVNEQRRNALAEYAQNTFGDDTYQAMPPVWGDINISIINSDTGALYKTLKGRVSDGVANITDYNLYRFWEVGTYDIHVVYDSTNLVGSMYGCAEATFEDAFTVPADREGKIVRVTANSREYGKVTGTGRYELNTPVQITATPEPGCKFVRWELNGEQYSVYPNTSFNIKEDMTFVAIFEPETYKVKINTNDDLGLAGTVEGDGTYEYGESVTITAKSKDGFVFDGWYVGSILISNKESYTFTAVKNVTVTAKFAKGVNVAMSGDSDCGYKIFVDTTDSDALDTLINSGKLTLADIRNLRNGLKTNKTGTTFAVKKDSTISFTVEIQDGYEKGEGFKVTALSQGGRKPIPITLTPNESGKYTFKASGNTSITVSGVHKIEYTPTPVLTYQENGNNITFTASGEGNVVLYVNNKAVSNPYTLERSDKEEVFSVYATAKVEGMKISERATLNNNSLGNGVAVPVFINESENGTVEVDAKYDAPGVISTLTVTPEPGYELDELKVEFDGGLIEVVEHEGKYLFTRPSSCVKVSAVFVERSYLPGDINGDGSVDISDSLLLFMYSMIPESYPISYAGNIDFTHDGNIDISDSLHLFMYSMMPDLYPIS